MFRISCVMLLVAASLVAGRQAVAADKASTYQVTGPVTELTDKVITVVGAKDGEKYEINRDAATKVDGELKVGAKVTIKYSMTAVTVAVKGDKADDKAEKGADKAK